MKRLRNKGEDLAAMLKELKVGDEPIFDAVSNYEITRTPGGYIYKNEYCGLCFPEISRVLIQGRKLLSKGYLCCYSCL